MVYIEEAVYYDIYGILIWNYFVKFIFIVFMEIVEIVIDEVDCEGGMGVNFFFDWRVFLIGNVLLFEVVMILIFG